MERGLQSVRRGPTSRRSRSGFEGKEVTVLSSATVASEMVVMAATIAAPSARARAARRERGMKETCILIFIYIFGGKVVWRTLNAVEKVGQNREGEHRKIYLLIRQGKDHRQLGGNYNPALEEVRRFGL